jgi:protein phosphatase
MSKGRQTDSGSSSAGYKVGSTTHVGAVRTENQDAAGYFVTPDKVWELLVVCDGMGGHAGGERASQLAVHSIGRGFQEAIKNVPPTQALDEAVRSANRAIWLEAQQDPRLRGMGTTCTVIAWRPSEHQAWLAHVGDSRIYRIRSRRIERLTRDHSAVQRMLDGGLITEEQAKDHPEGNVLSRTLGVRETVEPEVQGPVPIEVGDRLLACSDGLHGLVDERDIATVALTAEPQQAAKLLVELAIAAGGHDNVTVQILWRSQGKQPEAAAHRDQIEVVKGYGPAPRTASGTFPQASPEAATKPNPSGQAVPSPAAWPRPPEKAGSRVRLRDAPPDRLSLILGVAGLLLGALAMWWWWSGSEPEKGERAKPGSQSTDATAPTDRAERDGSTQVLDVGRGHDSNRTRGTEVNLDSQDKQIQKNTADSPDSAKKSQPGNTPRGKPAKPNDEAKVSNGSAQQGEPDANNAADSSANDVVVEPDAGASDPDVQQMNSDASE